MKKHGRKFKKKVLNAVFILFIAAPFITSSFNYNFNCNINPGLTLINTAPKSNGIGNQITNLNYSISYFLKNSTDSHEGNFQLDLEINGTQYFYENGTIKYSIGKNITDKDILEPISQYFLKAPVGFIENHSRWETFKTYFSYRMENTEPISDINLDNSSYTIFWLNTTNHSANYLRTYRNIKFFEKLNPITLGISNSMSYLTEGNWDNSINELEKNVRILRSYYLSMNIQNEKKIDLYYDKKWNVLLRGVVELYNADGDVFDEMKLTISLIDTNLNFEYSETNHFHLEKIQRITNIVIISVIIVSLSITSYFLFRYISNKKTNKNHERNSSKKKKKKIDILDKI